MDRSGQSVCTWPRLLVVVHDLVILLLEVIMFAIILLVIGLFLVVLLFVTRVIVASIVLMATVMLSFVSIALVASMVAVDLASMLSVAWVAAVRDGKMSHLLLFWLLYRQSDTVWKRLWAEKGPWAPFYLFLQICTDAPWAAQKRYDWSSLALWATASFDGYSFYQGS